MSNAKVKADSFWGDLANALLLSPPHRDQPALEVKESDVQIIDGSKKRRR